MPINNTAFTLLPLLADDYIQYRTVVISVICSVLTLLIYSIIRKLARKLSFKKTASQESELKKFSQAINRTMDLSEILILYRAFIAKNIDTTFSCVCVYDEAEKIYRAVEQLGATQAETCAFRADNPMIAWLKTNAQVIRLKDFQRTNSYRALWEREKKMLANLNIEVILPVMSDEVLTGITLLAGTSKGKPLSGPEINNVESAAAIVSIAMRNASLYQAMQDEAQRDSLTNLYNRRYFMRNLKQGFELSRFDTMAMLLISFDDFRLYNELYGTYEGDYALKKFAEIAATLVSKDGTVARFGGKEFIISLPFYDEQRANSLLLNIKEQLNQALSNVMDRGKRYLTLSAGICAYPAAASNADEMLTYVNMAVYTAKRKGKNRVEIYAASDGGDVAKPDEQSKRLIAETSAPTIFALTAAIDAKDHYTFNHSNNVSDYAALLAKEIGLDSEHVEIIRQAGLMHDIGKIGIPDSILSKTNKLTEEEYDTMKQHVELSIGMIRHIPALDYAIPAVIGHHERWDGAGYPRGLVGEEIPIAARVLCIADSFDAMTTKRPYRNGLTLEEALREVQQNLGTQFDPALGKVFVKLINDGKLCAADNGQIGVRR